MVKNKLLPFVMIGLVCGCILVTLLLFNNKIDVMESSASIPKIEIMLDGVSLSEVDGGSKDIKYPGNEIKVFENNELVLWLDDVELKGRGNGTWVQEKKPYRIKFNEKVDLFGMGGAKKWNLLANAMDDTNLRTEAAFVLEDMLGMEYTYAGRFVELYVNNSYRGLYYLTHAVEIGKPTVNLKNPYGVLVELDNLYWESESDYYATDNGDILVLKDIVSKDNQSLAMEDFMEDYNRLEQAVKESDYGTIEELIDVDSFVKYYLLNELSVNPDAYWTSFFMYKDGLNDKIHAGPGWDFDLAFANRKWKNWMGEDFYSPTETMIRRRELISEQEYKDRGLGEWSNWSDALSRIVFDLTIIPEFQDRIKTIYNNSLSGRKSELITRILNQGKVMNDYFIKDGERWNYDNHMDELKAMLEWIDKRYDYLESIYGLGNGSKLL